MSVVVGGACVLRLWRGGARCWRWLGGNQLGSCLIELLHPLHVLCILRGTVVWVYCLNRVGVVGNRAFPDWQVVH